VFVASDFVDQTGTSIAIIDDIEILYDHDPQECPAEASATAGRVASVTESSATERGGSEAGSNSRASGINAANSFGSASSGSAASASSSLSASRSFSSSTLEEGCKFHTFEIIYSFVHSLKLLIFSD
jgi:hypothetical protein